MPAAPAPSSSPQVIVLIGWLFAIVAVSGWFASERSASLPAYVVLGAVTPLLLWTMAAAASVLSRRGPAPFGEHGRRLWPAHAGLVAVCAVNGCWWLSATGTGLDRNYPVLVLSWAAALQGAGFLGLAWWLRSRARTRAVASHTLLALVLATVAWVAGGPLLAFLR